MEQLKLAVLLGVVLLSSLLLFVGYKIYQDRQRLHKPVVRKMLCAGILIIIWLLVVQQQPLLLWQHILAACSAQYGVLLYYCAIDQMLNNKRHRPVIRSRVFPATTLLVMIVVILDFRLGDHQPAFGACPYKLTSISYTETALNYFGSLYLDALIVWDYAKDLRRHTNLIYTARRSFCLLGFLVNLLGLLLLEGSLFLSLLAKDTHCREISSIYELSMILMAVLLVGGYALPDRFFSKALGPISAYVTWQQKRRQELLGYLHQTMVQIVPSVQLDCEQVQNLRVLIEISDARQVIWSQERRTQPITAEDEANHLLQLIRTHTEYDKPGEHPPALTHDRKIVKHNLAVARHLKSLQ
jgi:hypothetical protein